MRIRTRIRTGPLLILIFCLSGASALAFQVLWKRQLTLLLGGSAIAVSTILATFMGGLGLGGWLGGRLADRVKQPLRYYALAELLIGLSALATPFLLSVSGSVYLGLYDAFGGDRTWVTMSRAFSAGIILLVPTTLMGATLPFMARFYIRRIDTLGRGLGSLYGINIFGGVLGAALTGYYVILAVGVWNTFLLAVAVSLVASLAAFALSFVRVEPGDSGAQQVPAAADASSGRTGLAVGSTVRLDPPAPGPAGPSLLLPLTLVAFFISGFTGLAYEVLWTRALQFAIGSSVFAFTTVLVVFLLGLFLGSVLAGRIADRLESPLGFVGWVQLLGGATMVAAFFFVDNLPHLTKIVVDQLGAGNVFADAVTKIVPTAAVLIVPTVLLGFSFPILMKIRADHLSTLGRRLGVAYAINTAGAILGSLLAGYLLLPAIGLTKSIYAIALLNVLMAMALFASAARFSQRRLLVPATGVAAVALVTGIVLVDPRPLVENLAVVQEGETETLYYEEGHTATVAVLREETETGSFKNLQLYINLLGASVTDWRYHHQQYYTMLAILPTALHPDPRHVFVAGLASGVTTGAAALDERTEKVTCVEISPEVIRAAPFFDEFNFSVCENPRVRILADDARAYLATTQESYDLLISDCFLSAVTGTAALYSKEYFELCRSRLAPGGYMSIGVGGLGGSDRTVARTFCEVFPYVATFFLREGSWYNRTFLLGANEPFALEEDAMNAALAQPTLRAEMERYGIGSLRELKSAYFCDREPLLSIIEDSEVCTDDLPVIDFRAVAWAEGFVIGLPHEARRGLRWLIRTGECPMPFPMAEAAIVRDAGPGTSGAQNSHSDADTDE